MAGGALRKGERGGRLAMKPNSTSTVADKVAALMPRQGRYGSCFALASLTLVLPSEPRDNLKIALSDKLCANTAEISALFGVSPQNTQLSKIGKERQSAKRSVLPSMIRGSRR